MSQDKLNDKYLIVVSKDYKCNLRGEEGNKISITTMDKNPTTFTYDIVGVDDQGGHNIVADNKLRTFLERTTAEQFYKLRSDLIKHGVKVTLKSAGRTLSEQEDVRKLYKATAVQGGESEHHTGLGFDIDIEVSENFYRQYKEELGLNVNLNDKQDNRQGLVANLTPQSKAKIVERYLDKFTECGFIQRYSAGTEYITKAPMPEWWHFRYVGKEHAEEISKRKCTLEEYVASLGQDIKIPKRRFAKIKSNKYVKIIINKVNRYFNIFRNLSPVKSKYKNEDNSLIKKAIEDNFVNPKEDNFTF